MMSVDLRVVFGGFCLLSCVERAKGLEYKVNCSDGDGELSDGCVQKRSKIQRIAGTL
jgi:hypothetical protein